MKAIIALLLFASVGAQAQTEREKALEQQIETVCGGPIMAYATSKDAGGKVKDRRGAVLGPEDPLASPAFVRSVQHLAVLYHSRYPDRRVIVVLTSNAKINAWAVKEWMEHASLICMPTAMVEFMGDEDELAFIIAHEMGHTVDDSCTGYESMPRTNKALCEIRADEIGYGLLREAGYSPYAAAGAFGRLEMYSGDTQTGISGLFRQLMSDHPITPNRIEHMRKLLIQQTGQH